MEFDDQMRRFFGTDDLGAVSPEAMASGVERMRVEFGLETDKGRKFAMWSLLYMLGAAPDLESPSKPSVTAMRRAGSWTCSISRSPPTKADRTARKSGFRPVYPAFCLIDQFAG